MNSENLSLVLTSVASWNCKFSSGVNLKFLISQSYVHVSAACNSMSDWYRIFVATDKSHFHRTYHYISANFPVYHFLWHSIWDNCNCLISYHFWYSVSNKCIGDDTKAAVSQSANCIKKQNNKIWRKTIFNMADGIITPCNVARSLWLLPPTCRGALSEYAALAMPRLAHISGRAAWQRSSD